MSGQVGWPPSITTRLPRIIGFVTLLVTVLIHQPSLGQPLLEAHSFRQTQTAYTALIYHQQGIDLLHPRVPVLGAPFEIAFEFPLFQALASLVMDLGLAPDAAMRVTGLAMFVLTAALLWRFVARLADEWTALVALLAFCFSPLGLLWSRTSMIEYLATAGALGTLYFALRWHEDSRAVWWVAALVAAVIGMLVKPTTFALYALPLLILIVQALRGHSRPISSRVVYATAIAVLLLVPLAAGVAWIVHSDAIKGASQYTAGLTSQALTTWNYGTIDQRLNLATWQLIGGRVNDYLFGGASVVWIPLAFIGSLRLRRRWFAIALLIGAFAGPLVFTNLYWIHDYYLIALSPIAAAGVAIGARWLWLERRWIVPVLIGAGLVFAWLATMSRVDDYWLRQYRGVVDPSHHLDAAAYIIARSDPDERVVITGRGWNPATLYYAERWGLMIEGRPEDTLVSALGPRLAELRALGYEKLFHCVGHDPCTKAFDLTTDPPSPIP